MDVLRIYLRSLGKFQKLTRERELELIRQTQAGDREAGDDLVKSQALWVLKIAERVQTALPLSDVIQAGNVGLLEAIQRFDSARGVRLGTFAFRPILWQMQKAVRRDRREWTDWDFLPEQAIPFDQMFDPAPDPEAVCIQQETVTLVYDQLRFLPERSRQIIDLRTNGHSFRDVAAILGITRERVRQIECRAIAKLRRLVHIQAEAA